MEPVSIRSNVNPQVDFAANHSQNRGLCAGLDDIGVDLAEAFADAEHDGLVGGFIK